jgi:hypothetical protein
VGNRAGSSPAPGTKASEKSGAFSIWPGSNLQRLSRVQKPLRNQGLFPFLAGLKLEKVEPGTKASEKSGAFSIFGRAQT